MKRNLISSITFSLLFSISAFAANEKFVIDPQHSFVEYRINHLGFSNPTGKWYANGTIDYDSEKVQNSKVEVTIKVAEMVTGNSQLDEHLKGKLFFNTDKFPTATFVSDKITATGKDSAKVQGKLTVHGVTKPITLSIKLNKKDKNPITDKLTMGFSGSANLKRSDFGMTTLIPDLGDEVELNIQAEAVKS